jgi:ribosomal protein S18 acetylase RimI-like enzyme
MVTLTKAQPNDVLEIKKLLKETWTKTYSDIYSAEAIEMVTSEWHSPQLLKKQIENKESAFLVAKEENKIVGMCNAALTHEGTVINIQRLHVSPQYQGQGIGSILVKAVIKEFPNANKVDLEVEKQNFKAQAFYKKLGFHNSGEKVFEVKNVTIECFVMEKDLN